MSRAFVHEDAGDRLPRRDYHLPDKEDPAFDRAAANALLEAARDGETATAEEATGYRWGDKRLAPFVQEMLVDAESDGDERLAQLARRFLR